MLQGENQLLKEELDQVKNQRKLIETMRYEIESIRSEQTLYKDKCEEIGKELRIKEAIIERITAEHNKKLEEVGELKAIKEGRLVLESQAETKLALATQKLAMLASENDSMLNRISSLENEVDQGHEKIESLKKELEDTRQTLLFRTDQENVVGAEMTVLKKQINEKTKKLSELEKQIGNLKDENESLDSKLQYSNSQLLKLKKLREIEETTTVNIEKYKEVHTANGELKENQKILK
jgi:chromosome segregation ATPase